MLSHVCYDFQIENDTESLRLPSLRYCYSVASISTGNKKRPLVTSRLIGAAIFVWVVFI